MYLCNDLLSHDKIGLPKGIIFDCDGVLFDSKGANAKFYNLLKDALGLPPMNEEEEDYVHSASVARSVLKIVPPELIPEAELIRSRIDYRDILPYMIPYEGLHEILAWLRSKRIPMAVNTNRTTSMELVLDYFNLREYFNPVIVTGSVSRAKPSPEGVHKILHNWRVKPADAAFIGDSAVDEKTSALAGTSFWAFKNETLTAKMLIPNFPTLLTWLKKGLNR